ncbi:MAG: DNA internalization-related competence protein ComEC/Rec2 [Polyangia bacterium]
MRIIAGSWVAGVALARLCERTPTALLGYAALVSLVGLLVMRRHPHAGLALHACALAAWVGLPPTRITPAVTDGKPWTLVGRVDGMLVEGERTRLPLVLEQAQDAAGLHAIDGRITLSVPRLREPLVPGDELVVSVKLARARACNFGDCQGAWRLAADALDATASVHVSERVMRVADERHGFRAWLWTLRLGMRAQVRVVLPEQEATLVAALVLGDRSGLDEALEARFRAVGVTHLLSVSGLHLAFVAGLLYALVRLVLRGAWPQLGRVRPRDRWAAFVALPLVLAYTVLVGAEVATLRAALVVAYAFFAVMSSRRLRGADALAFAVLALLVSRPARLFDVSFQLSFVSALAMLAVPHLAIAETRIGRAARGIAMMLLASLAATLATAPLTAWWFSQIAPMGIVSNAVAVPLTELLVVPIGIAGALLSLALPSVGHLVLHVSGFCASLLLSFVGWIAPWSPVFTVGAPTGLGLVVCAVALLWLARRPTPVRLAVAVMAGIVAFAAPHLWAHLRPRLEITFLDVGQGDGALLVLPDGDAVIIDGGPDRTGRVLLRALQRRGIRRVRLVVLSHPHPDHAGGLAAVLDALPVDELWTNGETSVEPSTVALLAAAERHAVLRPTAHVLTLGAVTIEPLAPRDDAGVLAPDPLASDNDSSLVLSLRYAGRSVLFAGDIEHEAEARLVARHPSTVDVLKVPHHGSRTSSTDELLDALQPHVAIASLAEGNRYLFPHPDVVARYRARGVRLLRTDLDGAARMTIGESGHIAFECARGGCAD